MKKITYTEEDGSLSYNGKRYQTLDELYKDNGLDEASLNRAKSLYSDYRKSATKQLIPGSERRSKGL